MAALVKVGVPEALARERVADRHDAAEKGARPDGELRVLRANWLALRVFLAQAKRWRHLPMGGLAGLDATQIESTLRLMGVRRKEWPALFEQLLEMEGAAVEVIQARR